MNPLLLVHISAGAIGILAGAVSMTARKGSRLHAQAGVAFVGSIITMGFSGAAVAVTRWLLVAHAYQVGNFLMGLFTAYLAATGWVTGRRRAHEVGWQDWALLAVGALLAGSFVAAGIGTIMGTVWLQHGLGAPFFFIVGTIAALAFWGDVRLVVSGGIVGTPRLWLVRSKVNSVPVLVTLAYLIFWLVKMRGSKGKLAQVG